MKGVLKTIGLVFLAVLVLYVTVSIFFNRAEAASTEGIDEPETAIETLQPSADKATDSGEGVLPLPDSLLDIGTGLKSTEYTPETYIPPTYDPFSNKYVEDKGFEELIPLADRAPNSPPSAAFQIRTKVQGLADPNSGTTETEFIFDAYSSNDVETKNSKLKVRWDFESDGTPDSYFSLTKKARHTFEQPGTYTIKLEVLDAGGLTSSTSKTVQIVENTAPYAYFTFTPVSATAGHVYTFKTNHSYDSQYKSSALEYRFDWNGDGQWDTPYKTKTTWNHKYEDVGQFEVIMEIRDPEGVKDISKALITVVKNEPPVARISIEVKPVSQAFGGEKMRYYFDASGSSDPEGQKLQYRWDYNYTGRDDINFDTYFTYGKQSSGFYEIPGQKTIRLQVRDEDGAVGEAFVSIEV